MAHTNPAKALNSVRSGHICDRCNKRVRTGDLVRLFSTYYERGGWTLQRVWCDECGSTTIGLPTDGADEAVVEAVYWSGRLVGVTTVDRSRPVGR